MTTMDFRIIILSSAQMVARETEIVNELFEIGMPRFHLRKPGASMEDLKNYLTEINPKYYSKISIHHHHKLAEEIPTGGLNLTFEAMKKRLDSDDPAPIRGTTSVSIHSWREYHRVKNEADYVLISPVFKSVSKIQLLPKKSLKSLPGDSVRGRARIFALGGIQPSNIKTAFELGFDGIALLGHIWGHPYYAADRLKQLLGLPCLKVVPM
jgi:thiamine-phosphate pyrophosphorylase